MGGLSNGIMEKPENSEKVFLNTCLIMLGVCMMSMFAFYFMADIYEQQIHSEASELLYLTSSTIDKELRKIDTKTFQFVTDVRVQDFLADNGTIFCAYRVVQRQLFIQKGITAR
jgi:hypothetical protein